jgi:hypothetical protein
LVIFCWGCLLLLAAWKKGGLLNLVLSIPGIKDLRSISIFALIHGGAVKYCKQCSGCSMLLKYLIPPGAGTLWWTGLALFIARLPVT